MRGLEVVRASFRDSRFSDHDKLWGQFRVLPDCVIFATRLGEDGTRRTRNPRWRGFGHRMRALDTVPHGLPNGEKDEPTSDWGLGRSCRGDGARPDIERRLPRSWVPNRTFRRIVHQRAPTVLSVPVRPAGPSCVHRCSPASATGCARRKNDHNARGKCPLPDRSANSHRWATVPSRRSARR